MGACKSHPGIIGLDRVRLLLEACPEVKENQIAVFNVCADGAGRPIMGIAGIAIDGDMWRISKLQLALLNQFGETLLYLIYVQRDAIAKICPQLREQLIL